jgi:ubiquinone/menaquinone biosynthesis C-methylase UbiE
MSHDRDVERFNRWAPRYDRWWLQRCYFAPVHVAMLKQVWAATGQFRPACILDVGCGTGRLLRAAAERWPQARLLGVDPAEGMVEEARRHTPAAELHCASAEQLPLDERSVDLALSSFSLHHWADAQRGVCEIARVLRPGGRFCLADHTVPQWLARHERGRPLAELHALVKTAGLAPVSHRRLWWRRAVIVLAEK